VSVHWSEYPQSWMIVVVGYDFTGDIYNTELFVQGRKQETVYVGPQVAKFRITDI
jgi:hypothetical protein